MANPGFAALRGIQAVSQAALATAYGTPATPTAAELATRVGFNPTAFPTALLYMLGTMTMTPQQEFYVAEEERQSIARVHRATPVGRHGELRFEGSLQFQRMPHLYSMAFGLPSYNGGLEPRPVRSGVESDAGDDYATSVNARLWTFAPAMNEIVLPSVWGFVYGDNSAQYGSQDAIARNVEFRYEMNNAVMQSVDFFAKFPVDRDFLDIPQSHVDDAVSQFVDIYVGDVTAANGTAMGLGLDEGFSPEGDKLTVNTLTAQPGLINAATISIPTGFEMTRYSSGSLDFTDYSQMTRSMEIDLTLRHSDEGRAEYEKFAAQANRGRFIQIVTRGPEIETIAASGALIEAQYNHLGLISAAVLYNESPQFFTDNNGDDVFTMKAVSYHEPEHWERDFAAYVQTDKEDLDTN